MSKSACAVYDFRYNYESVTKDDLIKWLNEYSKAWTFQGETGDTGYKHWQGRMSLVKKRMKHQLITLFINIEPPNYLEPTTNVEHQKVAFYAMKTDTRTEGPYTDPSYKSNETFIPAIYKDITLYPWQQQIIESKKKRNMRKVNLIYDPRGNNGKSTLASVAELYHGAIDLPPINDFKELMALLCNICMDQNLRDPGLIFMDMPRAMRKDQLFGIYSAIEQIKKCKLYDQRHHYKCWWIECPEVWVFSNILPDLNYLSIDRWQLWEITEDRQLKELPIKPSNQDILDQPYI